VKQPGPAFSLSDLARLNINLSRRDALGVLTGIAGLGAFASQGLAQSRPRRPPVKSPPPKLGQTQGVVRWSQFVGPQFGPSYGIHYSGLIGMTQNSSDPKSFNVLDTYINQSGAQTVLSSEQNFGQPVGLLGNMIAVPCADGTIQTLVNGNGYTAGQIPVPSPVISNLLVINNNTLVYVDASNNLNAIQVIDGNTATTVFSGNLGAGSFGNVSVQVSGNTFLCFAPPSVTGASHTQVFVVTPNGTGITVVQQIDANLSAGPFCVGSGSFFAVGNDGTQNFIQQFSFIPPYTAGWTAYLGPTLTPGNLVVYSGFIYFAGNDGSVRSININTGTLSAPINLDPNPLNSNPLFIDHGAAIVCTPEGKVYAADLASQGASSVVYDLQSGSNPAYLFGVENGVCLTVSFNQSVGGYFAQGVDLANELRGYSSDSSLMAEDYVAGGSGYMPATPAYRTVVQLVDGNKNPRANTSVRIEATDAVEIVSGGQTYSLSQGGFVWLTTDASGTVNFVSQATDISSPALYIWAAFMNQGEAIVVYPDHDALATLTSAQGTDYQNATAFDGTSIMPSGVDANQVAQTVSSTLSGGASSLSASYGSNPYSSYPATTANMIYQATKGDTSRAFSVATAQSFTTNITVDPTTGNVTGVSYASGTPTLPPLVGGFGSFDDFVKDVVNGVKKVAQIAVTVAEEVAHQITAITGEIYQFTVQTLEQAAAVITGFFKTLFSDITKAIEWLSAIFDWAAIKETQAAIKGFVTNFQQQVRGYLNTDSQKITTALHTLFQTAEGDIQQTIAGFIGSIGGQTLQSQQQNGNDPKAPYAQAGATGGYAQTQSMHSKFQDNVGRASANAINATVPLTFAEVQTVAEVLWTQIPATIAPLKADLDAAITQFASSFGLLVTDPTKFVTQSFSDILTIMSDIAVIILKVADAILESVIIVIADLLDTIVNYATGGMQIPVLSELFQLIFGTPLTFLDLAAWVIAVPATIISKTVGATHSAAANAKPHNLLGEAGFQVVCWAAAQIFGSLVDAINDAINNDPASPISIMDLVCGLITFALSAPSTFNGNDPAICYFAFSIIPSIISFINIVLKQTKSEISVAYNTLSYLLLALFGSVNLSVAVVNASNNPAEFSDPDHLTLFENLFANLGLIQKMFYSRFPQGVVVLDVVCPTTAAFIGAAAAVA